jgi:hypothetical protein
MNRISIILKVTLLNLIALFAAFILWPYAITGIFASLVCGMKFNRWVSSLSALALAITMRIVRGKWITVVSEAQPHDWYYELFLGIVSWAVASIFVAGFARWPSEFRKGYTTVFTPQTNHS